MSSMEGRQALGVGGWCFCLFSLWEGADLFSFLIQRGWALTPFSRLSWLVSCPPLSDHSCCLGMDMGFPGGSYDKKSTCNAGDLSSIPGLGKSPGGGNGNPLQYSYLDNSMDRGAWWATVHGVTKRHDWTTKYVHAHTHTHTRRLGNFLKVIHIVINTLRA